MSENRFKSTGIIDFLEGPSEIEWIIDGLIPRGSVGIIAGESGVGKSWFVLDLALSIATGQNWLGRFETQKSKVLIVDEENKDVLLRNRLKRFMYKYAEVTNENLQFMVGLGVDITPVKHIKKGFVESGDYKDFKDFLQEHKPDLMIIDSLTRIHHFDENDSMAMSEVFKNVKRIVDNVGVTVLFTHHFNKGSGRTSRRIRGSSDIIAFPDYTLLVTRNGENGISKDGVVVKHDKSRWSEPVDEFAMLLNSTIENEYQLELLDQEKVTVWQWLLELLQSKTLTRNEIIAQANNKFSAATVDRELKKRKRTQELEQPTYGMYTLSESCKMNNLLNDVLS